MTGTQVTVLLPVQDFRNLLWSQCLRTGHCHAHQPLSAGSPPIPCPLKAAVLLLSALGILSSVSSWITNTLCMSFQMLLVRMMGYNHCKEWNFLVTDFVALLGSIGGRVSLWGRALRSLAQASFRVTVSGLPVAWKM